MPLYYVAMPQSIVIVTKPPFVPTPIYNVDGVRSKTQTPRATKFVSLYEDIPKKVNNFFVNQPLDPRGGGLNPLRPPRCFGLAMANPSMPSLPPNKPYHRPLNYLKYVKTFDPNVHVKVFKVVIRANNEIDDA